MATSQGQDLIRCQLCDNPVEHHCNLCHVDLCTICISRHVADKTKRHEVVDFINKKEGPILPECKSHNKTLCEMYCNDCNKPTCVLCVTTTHKKHDITDIKSIIENFKRRITADLEEMENTILPKYKKDFSVSNSSNDFDKIINAIQDQEDNICKMVREISSRLKDEVAKQKRGFKQKNKKVQLAVAKEGQELDSVIKTSKGILKSNDAKCILTYQSKNKQFREGPKQVQPSYPKFLSGTIRENQLQEMFGSLQRSSDHAPGNKACYVDTSSVGDPQGKPPSFANVPKSVKVKVHTPLEIAIKVHGFPLPEQISWFKDGEPLLKSREIILQYLDGDSTLVIHDTGLLNSGLYECYAENKHGNNTCRIPVQILQEEQEVLQCIICMNNRPMRVLQCGHAFCSDCTNNLSNCPICRVPIRSHTPLYL
uniref:E3 ubiquitin-protein ligase TRIM36-like n=1 Tax=Crassostrea virginica TaxID=6565 RepID=A0A8B8BKH6_CRAVI|nr:E3 ubiquitin-protein ligase TRIM36-like [Crassostrea virginica]